MNLHRVYNGLNTPAFVVIGGEEISIAAGGTELLDDTALAKMLQKYGPEAITVSAAQSIHKPVVKSKFVWIANMTGDPDAGKTVTVKVPADKGRTWVPTEVPNPKWEARTIKRTMQGSQDIYRTEKGEFSHNRFPLTYELPPYTRMEVDEKTARWMLRRDGYSEPHARRQIMKSREPSNFEPNMDWELDDIQIYLRLIDPECKRIGSNTKATIDKVKKTAAYRNASENGKKRKLAEGLYKEKETMLQRVFFRIANPAYRLPTRDEFIALKTGKHPDEDVAGLTEGELAALDKVVADAQKQLPANQSNA
jgi:hypothetical protein